jgi:hypothetical protein
VWDEELHLSKKFKKKFFNLICMKGLNSYPHGEIFEKEKPLNQMTSD